MQFMPGAEASTKQESTGSCWTPVQFLSTSLKRSKNCPSRYGKTKLINELFIKDESASGIVVARAMCIPKGTNYSQNCVSHVEFLRVTTHEVSTAGSGFYVVVSFNPKLPTSSLNPKPLTLTPKPLHP